MLNFEERLQKIMTKRKIISYSIPNEITAKEEDDAHKWWTSHKCFKDKTNWEIDIELDTLYPNIKLIPNSIATAIIVECPFCGEGENVADVSTW